MASDRPPCQFLFPAGFLSTSQSPGPTRSCTVTPSSTTADQMRVQPRVGSTEAARGPGTRRELGALHQASLVPGPATPPGAVKSLNLSKLFLRHLLGCGLPCRRVSWEGPRNGCFSSHFAFVWFIFVIRKLTEHIMRNNSFIILVFEARYSGKYPRLFRCEVWMQPGTLAGSHLVPYLS